MICKRALLIVPLMVLLLAGTLSGGCARHSSTYRHDTVQDTNGNTTVVVKESTTSTSDSGGRGILGGTFHLLGEIIAFPFEIIAGAIRFIF